MIHSTPRPLLDKFFSYRQRTLELTRLFVLPPKFVVTIVSSSGFLTEKAVPRTEQPKRVTYN